MNIEEKDTSWVAENGVTYTKGNCIECGEYSDTLYQDCCIPCYSDMVDSQWGQIGRA
jgi:hypothetical protein